MDRQILIELRVQLSTMQQVYAAIKSADATAVNGLLRQDEMIALMEKMVTLLTYMAANQAEHYKHCNPEFKPLKAVK